MIPAPRFTDSVADLPTHKFGPSSLTWWGIIGFMVIEGAAFALAFAAYFFLMGHEQGWPPEGRQAPDVLAGTSPARAAFLTSVFGISLSSMTIVKSVPARRSGA